jgi:hypothetical protein
MVESSDTFLRCPSCRSLVPTVSTRCNVCGANLDSAGVWAGQDEATKRKRRARQHTASVQDPDQIAAIKEAYMSGQSVPVDTGYVDDPLSAYIEEVEVESKPGSAVDKSDILSGKVSEELPLPGMLRPPTIPVASSQKTDSREASAAQSAPSMLQPPTFVANQIASPSDAAIEVSDDDEDDFDDELEGSDAPADGEGRRRRRRSRRRRRQGASSDAAAETTPQEETGESAPTVSSLESDGEPLRQAESRNSEVQQSEEAAEEIQVSREETLSAEVETLADEESDADESVDEERFAVSNLESVRDGRLSDSELPEPAASVSQPALRVQPLPKQSHPKKSQNADISDPNSPVAKENVMNAGAHAEFTPASDAKLYGWIISFDDPMGTGYELRESKFFITRAELKGSDFVLRDASVSTPHALITVGSGGVWVQDLMSETGVCVRHVGEVEYTELAESANDRLFDGDWVKFGQKEFLITLIPYETT